MNADRPLDGSDYLMLGFDHELRRHGFAGNTCQIVLELAGVISPDVLRERLAQLTVQFPILNARPAGWIHPRWRVPRTALPPQVRVHSSQDGIEERLFNEPLDTHRGELLRFDLVEMSGGRMRLAFTWQHALMDAPGAEHFLAWVGEEKFTPPAPASPAAPRLQPSLGKRLKTAWKSLHHLDKFCETRPHSIGTRYPSAPAELHYQTVRFSAEETATARAHAGSLCGLLGDAQFHATVSLCELHRLRARLGCASPSYVLPVPVGLRPKGRIEPVFSNQLSMLMVQLFPRDLDSVTNAVASFKPQLEQAMRNGLLESGRTLADLFRFLPRPIYVFMVKQGLRGEIGSLFFGDTAAVNPKLTNFLGVPVEDFTHVAAITPSPGLGVIFYYFRGLLRLTVVHSARVFTRAEADEFTTSLRARLLAP
jgi:hypothetical protein